MPGLSKPRIKHRHRIVLGTSMTLLSEPLTASLIAKNSHETVAAAVINCIGVV
jgi:hypothetical protein